MTTDPNTRLASLGPSDEDLELLHEHNASTWPGEADFDEGVERQLQEALDLSRPPPSD